MLDQYHIDSLMIGNRVTIYNVGGTTGITTLTDGPYIFYKVSTEEGKKQKYKEIFTEEVYKFQPSAGKQKFGKTYVVKSDTIKKYLTKDEITKEFVSKARLLEIYNLIRANSMNTEIQKVKRR